MNEVRCAADEGGDRVLEMFLAAQGDEAADVSVMRCA